jgi:hypothetical protein
MMRCEQVGLVPSPRGEGVGGGVKRDACRIRAEGMHEEWESAETHPAPYPFPSRGGEFL